MKPARFDYVAPTSVGEVVALLEQHGDQAKILAGGQSLMPLLNMRLARPGLLIDVNRVSGLDYIRETEGWLAMGAMTRKRAVEDSAVVRKRQPLLHAATVLIGHRAIRNRGTVGGSLVQADPAAEYPAVAVVLDAELEAVGPQGSRTIRAADFFVGYLTTALDPAEMLTAVRFPVLAERTGWSIQEVTRRHGDFAMAGAAVTVALDSRERCTTVRIVLFGVGPTPVRMRKAEEVLAGQPAEAKLVERAAQAVDGEIEEPIADIHATAEYRRALAQVVTRRALAEAVGRAKGGH